MNCPTCRSRDVCRISRKGVVSFCMGYVGRWPYRCRTCSATFYSVLRQPPPAPPPNPVAHIKVNAASHADMDRILLILNEALVRESGAGKVSVEDSKIEVSA